MSCARASNPRSRLLGKMVKGMGCILFCVFGKDIKRLLSTPILWEPTSDHGFQLGVSLVDNYTSALVVRNGKLVWASPVAMDCNLNHVADDAAWFLPTELRNMLNGIAEKLRDPSYLQDARNEFAKDEDEFAKDDMAELWAVLEEIRKDMLM